MPAITTEAQVANLALGLCGQRQLLDSLDEDSTEAQLAKAYFYSTVRELLQQWHWRFATKRQVLALTTEARDGWAFAYAAPADMLTEAPAYIWSGQREPGAGERIPFSVELNDADSGHIILTDMAEASLVYVREVPVALWSPGFVKAVAAQLAVYLASALPVKPELSRALQPAATLALQRAAASSANAAQADAAADSEFIRER